MAEHSNEMKAVQGYYREEAVSDTTSNEVKAIEGYPGEDAASDTINILITNVSTLSIRDDGEIQNKTRVYKDEKGYIFSGKMTNEAPIKSIAYRLAKEGYRLDKILFIESDKVRKKEVLIENKEYSHVDYLKEKIRSFLGEGNKKHTEFIDVEIKDEPSKDDVSSTVFDIYKKLLEYIEPGKEIHIYIESNGGVRYVLTMLLSLTKTLENYYKNLHIMEITSMVFHPNSKEKQNHPVEIRNTKDVYNTAQITGIADEFLNYGRTNSLQRYINEYKDELTHEERADVDKVFSTLYKLADDIQLCRTAMILDDFYGDENLKSTIEAFCHKYDPAISSTISILVHLLQLILEDLNQTIYKDLNLEVEKNPAIYYLPKTISWSLEKSFVQQSLTLCAERLPAYLLETGRIRLDQTLSSILEEKDSQKFEKKYYFVAHFNEFVDELKKPGRKGLLQEIKKRNRLNRLRDEDWNSIFKDFKLQDASYSADLSDLAEKVEKLCLDYMKLPSTFKEKALEDLFESHGFGKEALDAKVKISNKVTTSMRLALLGMYEKEGIVKVHENLVEKEQRIGKVLPVLVKIVLDQPEKASLLHEKKVYERMISELFAEDVELKDNLIERYSSRQSQK